MGTFPEVKIVGTGLLSYSIHKKGIFICFVNFLRFVLFPNFCSEILRKALFLESHRNSFSIGVGSGGPGPPLNRGGGGGGRPNVGAIKGILTV